MNEMKKEEFTKLIDEEKKIVKDVCLGLVHPSQENQKEFTEWLQNTVIFHLENLKKRTKKNENEKKLDEETKEVLKDAKEFHEVSKKIDNLF